jgi:hypothetical protein
MITIDNVAHVESELTRNDVISLHQIINLKGGLNVILDSNSVKIMKTPKAVADDKRRDRPGGGIKT